MLPIQENSGIDFDAFAGEFGDDEGPLMDLGQGDQTQVEQKAVETPVVEEVVEPVEGEQPVTEEVVEEQKQEAPQTFQFTYNNQPYEVSVDQIIELNNGYMRQDDYTKKLQWWSGWFQQHQGEVGFVQNLNKYFQLKPEKAEFFYKHVINDEPVQGQAAPATNQTEKTVQELLAEQPQTPQQQQQQPQFSPEVVQLYNIVQQQQQQLRAQQEWREDYQLDQSLNLARQKYGDFDENAVLKWMDYLKTEDPEIAINRMIAEAWAAQARQGAGTQRPQQQMQRPAQVQQPAPHVEGGGRGRGVAAATNTQKQQPKPFTNWSEAQQALLQSGIF